MSKRFNKYHKGSEWRKWDLHLHAPSKYTNAKNDQYIGTNIEEKQANFISELKTVTDISVIGITDYFSLEGYKFVLSKKEELSQFDLILPNIELRIVPVTNKDRKINLHIIPNTEILSIEEIERFLYKFEFGPDKLTCKETDLIHLGKKTDSTLSNEEAFKRGLNEFSISYDKFFEVYNSIPDNIKENILIGVSNNSNDGVSGIKDIQGIRNIIYSGVHFIFSSQPADRDYFLGHGTDSIEIIKQKYGNLKPCLHGSDYHGSKGGKVICVPDLNRFCWIKADTTFEGLKQIQYEPEDRVILQANKPEEKAGYQVIDRVEISSELISNSEISFNANLNSIIGGRSSGKSVLLGAIAQKVKTSRSIELSDADYQEFVQSVSSDISVIWKDGQQESNREVEYFEQGYMHEIARDASQLNKIVKDILIQKGKETILDDYARSLSENSKSISSLISNYYQLLQEVQDGEQKARDKGDKKGIEDEITKLKDELQKITVATITEEEKQEYDQINDTLNKNTNKINLLSKDIESLDKLKLVSIFKDNMDYEFTSFSDSKKSSLTQTLNAIMQDASKKWKDEIEKFVTSCCAERESLTNENEVLKRNVTYIKVHGAYKDNAQLSEYEEKIKMQTDKHFEILSILTKVNNLKKQLYQTKDKIKTAHKSFYDDILRIIPELSDAKDGLEIKAKWGFDTEKYRSILLAGLNLQGYANQYLANYQFEGFSHFESHQFDLFEKLEKNELTLKGGYNSQRLITSLISTNFFNLIYDIEYEGDDFKKMSDGKKAFVVLKLLLDFNDKNCPILIDQPEDDLDNRAIYNDLVQYIRKKKKLRQIIVATHNPNIVVGADSELVICANQHGEKNLNQDEKQFQYVMGSLEHSFPRKEAVKEILESQGTREHVCEVLEGGNSAFKLRERKYSIKE